MDRIQLLLVGLPLFLFSTDVFNLFLSHPPPKPSSNHHHHHHQHVPKPSSVHQPLDLQLPTQQRNSVGYGHTVTIDFCSSCSYRSVSCLENTCQRDPNLNCQKTEAEMTKKIRD